MGQAPTSQARPRDTDHLRPSNLAARTLNLWSIHTLSTFGGDPCPVRRGLVAAVKCYVRKARFFLCRQRSERTPSLPTALLAGFSTMKGNPVLFSVFWYDNCWPNVPGTRAQQTRQPRNKNYESYYEQNKTHGIPR